MHILNLNKYYELTFQKLMVLQIVSLRILLYFSSSYSLKAFNKLQLYFSDSLIVVSLKKKKEKGVPK